MGMNACDENSCLSSASTGHKSPSFPEGELSFEQRKMQRLISGVRFSTENEDMDESAFNRSVESDFHVTGAKWLYFLAVPKLTVLMLTPPERVPAMIDLSSSSNGTGGFDLAKDSITRP